MQNFRKLAELKIPKNRGELYNNVNIAKSKNWKSVKIREIFRNSKNKKLVLENDIMKAYAKFQEASSI